MNSSAVDHAELNHLLLGEHTSLLLIDRSSHVMSNVGRTTMPWSAVESGSKIDLPSYFAALDRHLMVAGLAAVLQQPGYVFKSLLRLPGQDPGFRFVRVKLTNAELSTGVKVVAVRCTEATDSEIKLVFKRWNSHIVERLGKCSDDQLNDEVLRALGHTSRNALYDFAEITVSSVGGRADRWFWSRNGVPLREQIPCFDFSAHAIVRQNGPLPPVVERRTNAEPFPGRLWGAEGSAMTIELEERWGAGMTTTMRFGYPTLAADAHLDVAIEAAYQRFHAFQPALARIGAGAVTSSERHRAATIFEQLSDFVIVWSPAGKILFANKAFARALQIEPWQAVGLSIEDLVVDHGDLICRTIGLAEGETGTGRQVHVRLKDRTLIVEANTTNLCHDDNVGGYLSVARDIAGDIEASRKGAEHEQLTHVIASISNRFVTATTTSTSANISRALGDISQAFPIERLLVWQKQPDGFMRISHEQCAVGVKSLGSSIPRIEPETLDLLTVALEGQPELCVRGGHGNAFVTAVEAKHSTRLGAILVVGLRGEDGPLGVLTFSAAFDDNGELPGLETLKNPLICSTLQTVGELFASVLNRAASQEALAYTASHDTLTGLANRRLLLERAGRMLDTAHRRGNGIGILFMDLDDFKTVNDTLGHDAGDELLKDVGNRLLRLSVGSTVVARFGGDEFVVLFESSDPDRSAHRLAGQIASHMASPFAIRGRPLSARVSIGGATIAAGHTQEIEPGDLVRRADMAMYQAKRRGGNAFEMFSDWLEDQVRRKFNLHEELAEAIATNQLELYFQPQIKLATAEPVGCEALVRWRHPEKGFMLPNEFIAVAEQTGLIGDLGDWVFRRAVEAARDLIDKELVDESFTIAVNVSSKQLVDPDLVPRFLAMTDALGVPATQFTIELTESTLAERDRVIPNLEAFRAAGFRTSIDDFGTGFSSLSYLRDLPLDELKIDRSFIKSLGEDRRDLDMVWALVEMAHSLGLEVVAEGVETVVQRTHLENMGCNVAQGWLFAKAMPLNELVATLGRVTEDAGATSKLDQLTA